MGMPISTKQNTSPSPAPGISDRTFEGWIGLGGGMNSIAPEEHRAQEKLRLLKKKQPDRTGKPKETNVRRLSLALSKELGRVLRRAGISVPLELNVDEASAEIRVKGERPDKEKILEAIGRSGDIEAKIRNIAAIGSHVVHIAEHLEFQREYLDSSTPDDVVAKYSYLFSPQGLTDLSLLFDGNSVRILSDGKPVCGLDEDALASCKSAI